MPYEEITARGTPVKHAIAYIRVSTQKQGRSGLGLEAQQAAITSFAAAEGFSIAETFVEIETGKGADALETRPQLAAALAAAAACKGTVIVAKLDRLTRDVHFGSGLMARGVSFKVAEKERELISTRTKAALSAARERGQRLGSPNSCANQKNRSVAFAEGLRGIVAPIAHLTSRTIAAHLNDNGVVTPTGGAWSSVTVLRLIDRLNLKLAKEAA
jgi:DNA invertase Pin-like site-specific DNA recombinase